jgi:Protein of unknown function (DUF3575)
MSKKSYLLTLFFFIFLSHFSFAQRFSISLNGQYGIYQPSSILLNQRDGYGLALSGQGSLKKYLSYGATVQWQYQEPTANVILWIDNNIYAFSTEYNLWLFKPNIRWWFSKEQYKGVYLGLSANWNYLTIKNKGLSSDFPASLADPLDQSGLGGGVLYGFQHTFPSGFGLFVEGCSDFMWFDIGNDNTREAQSQHAWGIGISKVF